MSEFIMIITVSTISALCPMLAYTALVWWLDRYEREPVSLVLTVFAYGAVVAPLLALVGEYLVALPVKQLAGASISSGISVILLAPVIEEAAKALPLFWLRFNRNFDNTTDGIVYGSAIGFGFGMTENLAYFIGSYLHNGLEGFVWTIGVRTLFSAALHAFATGLIGYFFGKAKFQRGNVRRLVVTGFLISIALHSVWNSVITYAQLTEKPIFLIISLCAFPVMFLALFLLMQRSLREESHIIRQELAEEALFGVIPSGDVNILPYYHRRIARGWIDETIKKSYVSLATTLAFKKHRARICRSEEKSDIMSEIDLLRDTIRRLRPNCNDVR